MFFKKSGEEEEKRPDEEEEEEEEEEGAFFPSAPVMSRHIGPAAAGDRPEVPAVGAGAAARTGLGTYGLILSLQNFLTSDKFKKKSSPSFSMPLAMF